MDDVTDVLLDLLNAGVIEIVSTDDQGEPFFRVINDDALDELIRREEAGA